MGSFDELWRNVWAMIWWRVAILVSVGLLASSASRLGSGALSMAIYGLLLPGFYIAGLGAHAEVRGEDELAIERYMSSLSTTLAAMGLCLVRAILEAQQVPHSYEEG